MLRSVQEVGILVPIVVRDADADMYEILAGHNRVNAAKQVGLETVPARVLENISDEQEASAPAGGLHEEQIQAILSGTPAKKPKAAPPAKVKSKVWTRYLPANTPPRDVENTIEKALAFYFENGGGED